MSVISNLYPPIMPDIIPAFIRTEPCRIYFSISSYNNVEDIKNVQISLVNQKSNTSAFKYSSYPSGIKIAPLQHVDEIKDDYAYYITIDPSEDLEGDAFGLNQFYKIQIRFTSVEAEDPPSYGRGIATWLSNNIDYFSEWSTVCLIKGIEQPQFSIQNLDPNSPVTLQNQLTEIVGKMYFNTTEEKEYLKNYTIKIYKSFVSSNNLVVNSGDIYTNEFYPNEIYYELNYDLKSNIDYILFLTYTTNNLYLNTISFGFRIKPQEDYTLDGNPIFEIDEENGRIKIGIDFSSAEQLTEEDLNIKRTSSKTNFTQWETLKTITHPLDGFQSFVWYDTSIENGVWYMYRIQQNTNGGKKIDSPQPLMCVFEDIFLTTGSKQLKIQFNPNISNLKYNVTESQQTTLGSQFPYIKRNGNNFFRTFSIGGLITSLMDTTEWYDPNYYDGEFHSYNAVEPFTSKEQIYGTFKFLYDEYNENNNINDYQDYIYEKEFRQKVQEFLYKNNIKLFRSMTQVIAGTKVHKFFLNSKL